MSTNWDIEALVLDGNLVDRRRRVWAVSGAICVNKASGPQTSDYRKPTPNAESSRYFFLDLPLGKLNYWESHRIGKNETLASPEPYAIFILLILH